MEPKKKTFYQYLKGEIERGNADFMLKAAKDENSSEIFLSIGAMGTVLPGDPMKFTDQFQTSGPGSNYIKIS